jgi:hypothetical protein
MKRKINKKLKSAKKTRLNKFQNTKKRGGGYEGPEGPPKGPEVLDEWDPNRREVIRGLRVTRNPDVTPKNRSRFSRIVSSAYNFINPNIMNGPYRGRTNRRFSMF